MIDYAHKETDKIIEDLGKSFRKEYAKAYLETSKKLNDYLKGFEKRDAAKRKALEDAKKSDISIDEKRKLEKEYKDWRVNQMLTGDRWKEMLDTMSQDYINANDKARGMVNDKALDVYALNHNYGTYQVETETLLDTSYTLYDRSTVNRLISKNPKMLPEASKRTLDRIKRNKEKVWCQQKLQSAILQGVIQGEPLMKIAGRLRSVSNMTTAQSMRNARTMLTNAQSAGRYDSYRRAKDIGLNIKVVWIATLDQHTRHEHRMLDGQMQDVDEPFLVDGEKIMYPADFGGADYKVPPELIYNCRCTIGAAVPGTKLYEEGLEGIERFSRLEGMSYEEWKGMHEEEAAAAPEHVVVQGRDITATWSRRPDQFDFEIEDVINAQGFDGKPRVVSKEEFDEAVKAANGGDGFIAQRSYSAPDLETLDAYRDQLYNGKWYVDCSTGGAQYGQGMYCAADYSGKLSDGIKAEMAHYKELYTMDLRDESIPFEQRLFAARSTLSGKGYGDEASLEWAEAYISKDKGTAKKLMEVISEDKRDEINNILRTEVINPSYTETLTLDPSAKIITYDEAMKARGDAISKARDEYYAFKADEEVASRTKKYINSLDMSETQKKVLMSNYHFESYEESTSELLSSLTDKEKAEVISVARGDSISNIKKEVKEEERRLEDKYRNGLPNMDVGAYAAALGYDAINAEGHGASDSYTVVLNRTKLIILEDN